MSWSGALAVFVGGGFGSLLRYGLSVWIRSAGHTALPYATFAANLLASAILAWAIYRWTPTSQPTAFLMLTVGFCGGFSTFSTFSLETFQLLRNDQWLWAIGNVLVSVFVCVFVMYLLSKSLK